MTADPYRTFRAFNPFTSEYETARYTCQIVAAVFQPDKRTEWCATAAIAHREADRIQERSGIAGFFCINRASEMAT